MSERGLKGLEHLCETLEVTNQSSLPGPILQWEGNENTTEHSLKNTKERESPDKVIKRSRARILQKINTFTNTLWKQQEGVLECDVRVAVLG